MPRIAYREHIVVRMVDREQIIIVHQGGYTTFCLANVVAVTPMVLIPRDRICKVMVRVHQPPPRMHVMK